MLQGKLAFVTGKLLSNSQIFLCKYLLIHTVVGAGGGIGRAICRLMAREGATVVAADVNINHVNDTVAELSGKTVRFIDNLNIII